MERHTPRTESSDASIEQVGMRAHNLLVLNRRGGSYIKSTTDEVWAAAHGTHEVDLATCAYKDLPKDWKSERDAGARIALQEVTEAMRQGTPLDSVFIEQVAARLHDAWLLRNAHRANTEQLHAYGEMSEHEKEKDRIFVRAALEVLL